MKKVANLPEKERAELFRLTAEKRGLTEVLIEKDFWVCFVLKHIFENSPLKEQLIFKGGTTLSKVYGLISRFSEDIDLILDWELLGISDEEAWQDRSATQQDKFNKLVDEKGREFIADEIVPVLAKILLAQTNSTVSVKIDANDGHVIYVNYPASFRSGYLLPNVKLEIGPRASKVPHEEANIQSYAAQEYPSVFDQSSCVVKTITSERTFWEKVTILHQIAMDEAKPVPPRHSRHYYDVYQMAQSTTKGKALGDLQLLADVVAFKSRFYRSPRAQYDLAKPGTLKLIPSETKQKIFEDDYHNMREMIFG